MKTIDYSDLDGEREADIWASAFVAGQRDGAAEIVNKIYRTAGLSVLLDAGILEWVTVKP